MNVAKFFCKGQGGEETAGKRHFFEFLGGPASIGMTAASAENKELSTEITQDVFYLCTLISRSAVRTEDSANYLYARKNTV